MAAVFSQFVSVTFADTFVLPTMPPVYWAVPEITPLLEQPENDLPVPAIPPA
jgi:hypothetical protein